MMARTNSLLSLLFLLLTLVYDNAQQVNHNQQQAFAEIAAKQSGIPQITQAAVAAARSLEFDTTVNNFTESCSLCSGFPVLNDALPRQEHDIQGIPLNASCGDLNTLFSTLPAEYSEFSACLAVQALFAGTCCQVPSPPYVCEQSIKSSLLEDYDTSIMPLPQSRVLQVELLLDLLHISELSTKDGTVNIFVWLHLTWNDPRLAWDIDDTNCTASISVRASLDMEQTEIYVPDVDLLNQASGGVQQFPDALATVYHDGTVVWKRNGGLKGFCSFTGLDRFPFDTLGCTYLIGAWERATNVNIILAGEQNTGWSTGQSLDNVIYHEYTLVKDQTQVGHFNAFKSVVYYNLYFKRSSRFYLLKVLLPTIVFTILAFGVFFLDLRLGERLSYGLTVLLVIIAQDIATASLLPITDKQLWINTFVEGSFYWVLITNLESVFVAWLYYLGDDNDDQICTKTKSKEETQETKSANGDVDDEEDTKSNLISSRVAVKPMLQGDDVENQGGAYDGPVNSLEARGMTSSEHKAAVTVDQGGANEQGGDVDTAWPDRTSLFGRISSAPSKRLLTFRQLLVQKNQPMKKRHRAIKRIDTWCFWILSSTYMLFVIIMFATNSLWNDGNSLYVQEDQT